MAFSEPAGPMMQARARAARGDLDGALPAYTEAVRRSCCSKRLRQERLIIARARGRTDLVEQDEAWLSAYGSGAGAAP